MSRIGFRGFGGVEESTQCSGNHYEISAGLNMATEQHKVSFESLFRNIFELLGKAFTCRDVLKPKWSAVDVFAGQLSSCVYFSLLDVTAFCFSLKNWVFP